MQHFDLLDTLLKKSFDELQMRMKNKAHNAQYLSSEYIQHELTEPAKKMIDLGTLDRLQERLKLSDLEMQIILILFVPELDSKYERIYAYLQDNMNRTYPTVQLLALLLCETPLETQTLYDHFIKPSKFSMLHLIDFVQEETHELLFQQPLRLSAALRNYLMGDLRIENALQPYCYIAEPVQQESSMILDIEHSIEKGIQNGERYLINIYGTSAKNKKHEALKIASRFGFGLLCIDTREAVQTESSINRLTELMIRDALLTGTVLYFEDFDAFLNSVSMQESKLFLQLEQLAWLTFFSTPDIWSPKEIPKHQHFYTLHKTPTVFVEREKYWKNELRALNDTLSIEVAADLANTFHFSEDEIDNIIHLAETQRGLGKKVDKKLLFNLVHSRISTNLSQYAQQIKSTSHMHDMVTAEKTKEQLNEIVVHYRYKNQVFQTWGYEKFFQSEGLTLLFSGPSGTGKTMAASVLANTLGLELYKIDLSQMTSKYIGETEKNLSKLFKAAEESAVILFFDEADAIFGKRTELKDAHDRYANIEVSYLLQRIEEYDGIVILASNFRENIDEAFLRRLRFVIDFPTPDAAQRSELWYKLLPFEVLEKPLDFHTLAKNFKLSGANIRNIALYAAFNAAGEEKKIEMKHIHKALKNELEKVGVTINEDDLKMGNNKEAGRETLPQTQL